MSLATVTVASLASKSSGDCHRVVPGAEVADVFHSELSAIIRLRPKSHRQGQPRLFTKTLSYQTISIPFFTQFDLEYEYYTHRFQIPVNDRLVEFYNTIGQVSLLD